MKYQKVKRVSFKPIEKPNEKNWVIVEFENGSCWMPALVDLGWIISMIGQCEDIKYPNGYGREYTKDFLRNCFGKTKAEIIKLYKEKYDPNDLLKVG